MSSLKGVVNCYVFFTVTCFCFLKYDLASACQISSKRNYSRQCYDVISIFQDGGHRVGNLLPVSVLVTAHV